MSTSTVPVRTEATAADGAPGTAGEQHMHRRWWALAVIGLAQLMVVLDATIVNIALPSAQRDLSFDNNGRQWIITAYSLAFGSLLLLGGRLADLIGRRLTFIIGLIGFAGASALGGAANGFTMLVVARTLQGMFGAILAPSAMSLLTTTFTDPKERSKAFGVFGAIAGSGGAIGLLLGGVLTEHLNWRWTLYVNDAIAVFAVLGALAFVRGAAPAQRPKLDLLGTLLAAAGLFGVVYGFSSAETHGWHNWMCWGFLAAGGLLIALFVVWETRARYPLLPLRVLADRNRAGSYVSVFVSGTGMFGVFLFLTYYLQQNLLYTPVRTGLAFLPMIGMLMLTAQLATNLLIPRLGPKPVVPFGMAMAAGGLVLFTRLDLNSTYPAHVLPPLLMMGFGLGLVMPPAMSLATLGVARQDQGVASAMVNTMQQVGGSIGTALFNTVAATAATAYAKNHIGMPDLQVHAALHSYSTAYWWAAAFFAAGLLISVTVYRKGRPVAQTPPLTEGTGPSAAPPPQPTRARGHHAKGAAAPSGSAAAPAHANGTGPASALAAAPAAEQLRGHVLDTAGHPVPGAAVTLIGPGGGQLARAQAAADGGYALPSPGQGAYVLIASASGHQPRVVTVPVGPAPTSFDLQLAASGDPVGGALVVATDARGDVAGSVQCDGMGEYRLSDLTPGLFTLAVSAPGYQPSALTVDLQNPAAARQDIELRPAAVVSGTIRDGGGRPLTDIRVTLLDPAGNVMSHHTTGEDGAYAFTDLPDGYYTVVAGGYPPQATPFTLHRDRRASLDIELHHED
jgi:EmrB/QacA subfamily drug resistance transporter